MQTYSIHYAQELLKQKKQTGRLYFSQKNKAVKELIDIITRSEHSVILNELDSQEFESRVKQLNHSPQSKVPFILELEKIEREQKKIETLNEFLAATKSQSRSLVVVLDGITDVHNLGAILRSCDAFGVDLVVVPQNRNAPLNETVKKTSAGASAWVPFLKVANISQALKKLQSDGFWVYGTAADGHSVHETEFSEKTVLVLGNEGKGMRELTQKNCDFVTSIPMEGHMESVNVSVAAGIFLYEIRRQLV